MNDAPLRTVGKRHVPVSRTHWGHPERSVTESKDPAISPPATPDLPTGTGDYWIYILTNPRRTVLYIGVTNGLLKRVSQHTLASGSHFAGRYHANLLIYYENFSDPRDAIAREKQLKRWMRAKKEALIARLNPTWVDLGAMLRGDLFPDQARGRQVAPGPSTPLHSAQDDPRGGAHAK